MMNRFFFLPIIILGLSILSVNSVFASPVLTLTPTSGPVSSSVNFNGTGFSSNTAGSSAVGGTGSNSNFTGFVWTDKFTGLPVGGSISNLMLKINTKGNGNGTITRGTIANTGAFKDDVWVDRFATLPAGGHIKNMTLTVSVSNPANVRFKIYADDGGSGKPGTLLAETGSLAVPAGVGLKTFAVPNTTIPSDQVVWAGFEVDTNAIQFNNQGGGHDAGFVAHVYNTGPNPFGVMTNTGTVPLIQLQYLNPTPAVRVKIYQDNGALGAPKTLLSESGSTNVLGTGNKNVTISATVPADGNLWAGFETNSSVILFDGNNVATPSNFVAHVYNTGPNPFGVNTTSYTSPKLTLFFNSIGPVSLNFDGAGLPTTPVSIFPNVAGSFAGTFTVPSTSLGTHTVQAIDSLGLMNSTKFIVTSNTLPYVTDLHYTALSDSAVSLAWSTPPLNNHTSFHGYQIRYTTPYGTPNTVLVNNTNSSTTAYNIAGLLGNTQYSFQIGTWANSTDFFSLANILNFQTFAVAPPNLTPGNLNFSVGTNPIHVGYQFFRENINSTSLNLYVSFPITYNSTCNLNYEFANTNKTYNNLSTVANGTGRVKADFQFINVGSEIINTVCRDIKTNDTGHYTVTNSISTIPLVQQVQNFENGVYGTAGQFGAFDLIELIVIILSTIALNRVDERVGAFVMIFVLGGLAFFHIGSFPVIIFGALAIVILLIVGTGKKLDVTP